MVQCVSADGSAAELSLPGTDLGQVPASWVEKRDDRCKWDQRLARRRISIGLDIRRHYNNVLQPHFRCRAPWKCCRGDSAVHAIAVVFPGLLPDVKRKQSTDHRPTHLPLKPRSQ
jgi:hypothetical protein